MRILPLVIAPATILMATMVTAQPAPVSPPSAPVVTDTMPSNTMAPQPPAEPATANQSHGKPPAEHGQHDQKKKADKPEVPPKA
ncbi:hypothetical protein [Sandarakinorhabdus sp.]|uniref:hypothetical protein n=1 Tax=Sandarakinorhabdus sp. TaxID=1916663 RepID=UPI00286E4458|nr:hypothetical protein [Sandarakinorhabdus sp.]